MPGKMRAALIFAFVILLFFGFQNFMAVSVAPQIVVNQGFALIWKNGTGPSGNMGVNMYSVNAGVLGKLSSRNLPGTGVTTGIENQIFMAQTSQSSSGSNLKILELWKSRGKLNISVFGQSGDSFQRVSWNREAQGQDFLFTRVFVADLSGNGVEDLVLMNEQIGSVTVSIYAPTTDGNAYSFLNSQTLTGLSPTVTWLPVRAQGNGQVDLVQAFSNGKTGTLPEQYPMLGFAHFIFNSKTNDFVRNGVNESQINTGIGALAWLHGDIDGDGKEDIVQIWYDETTDEEIYSVFVSDGQSFKREDRASYTAQAQQAETTNPSTWYVADVNGDGKADIVQVQTNTSTTTVSVSLSNGNYLKLLKEDSYPASTLQGAGPFFVTDLNQDGKMDLLGLQNLNGRLGYVVFEQLATSTTETPTFTDLFTTFGSAIAVSVGTPALTFEHSSLANGASLSAELAPGLTPMKPVNLGINRANFGWAVSQTSNQNEVATEVEAMGSINIKVLRAGPNAKNGKTDMASYVSMAQQANLNGVRIHYLISVQSEDFQNYSAALNNAGSEFKTLCGWPAGSPRLSMIDSGLFQTDLENQLQQLTRANPPIEVNSFELFNEINWVCFNGDITLGAAEVNASNPTSAATSSINMYVKLMQIAYPLVKQYYPNAEFVTAGLVPGGLSKSVTAGAIGLDYMIAQLSSPTTISSTNIIQNPIASYADGIGIHLYVSPTPPALGTDIDEALTAIINNAAVMRPIWITEWGYRNSQNQLAPFQSFMGYLNSRTDVPFGYSFLYSFWDPTLGIYNSATSTKPASFTTGAEIFGSNSVSYPDL